MAPAPDYSDWIEAARSTLSRRGLNAPVMIGDISLLRRATPDGQQGAGFQSWLSSNDHNVALLGGLLACAPFLLVLVLWAVWCCTCGRHRMK